MSIQKRLKKKVLSLAVRSALNLLTTAERALSTARNRLSPTDSKPQAPKVWGCSHCLLICEVGVYVKGDFPVFSYCPFCGKHLDYLGRIPHILEDVDGHYLIGDNGVVDGPHPTDSEAQAHLWDWFRKSDLHGKSESNQEKLRKGDLRLASVEGGDIHWEAPAQGEAQGSTEEVDEEASCKSSCSCEDGWRGGDKH